MWLDTMDSISSNEEKWRTGYFANQLKQKCLLAKLLKIFLILWDVEIIMKIMTF